jgi:hypothetical protein
VIGKPSVGEQGAQGLMRAHIPLNPIAANAFCRFLRRNDLNVALLG